MRATLLALMVLLTFVMPLPVRAEDSPSITTWGKATIYVVPDRVVISVSVHTTDSEFAKAANDNHERGEKLMAALKGMGLDEKSIEQSNLGATPLFAQGVGLFGGGAEKRVDLFRSYIITVTDMKLIDRVVETAMTNGGTDILAIELQCDTIAKAREEARLAAVRMAKDKAVSMSKVADAHVGKALNILEASGNGYVMASNGMVVQSPDESTSDQASNAGKIRVEAAVRVTFELK